MLLLDTNVLSELRKIKQGRANVAVSEWARDKNEESFHLSCITIQEIETGLLLIERKDPEQGTRLRDWLEGHVLITFRDRILPIDLAVSRRCAALQVPNPRSYRDAFIAATALVHSMTVVTRNIADFEPTGVPVLNPWAFDG